MPRPVLWPADCDWSPGGIVLPTTQLLSNNDVVSYHAVSWNTACVILHSFLVMSDLLFSSFVWNGTLFEIYLTLQQARCWKEWQNESFVGKISFYLFDMRVLFGIPYVGLRLLNCTIIYWKSHYRKKQFLKESEGSHCSWILRTVCLVI
jgi:hypothetical protein